MIEWVVSITIADPDNDASNPQFLLDLAEFFTELDAYATRPRDGQIVIHTYVYASNVLEATTVAHGFVAAAFDPIGIEAMTEAEFAQRADEPTMPELMSAAEIAEELGVSRQRVHQLRDTAAFPAPLADLRGGAVWDARAVRKFGREWTRTPGRPRAAAEKVAKTPIKSSAVRMKDGQAVTARKVGGGTGRGALRNAKTGRFTR